MDKPARLSPTASPVAREVHRRATDLGLSPKRLADKAGVNETYVRDLYVGKSRNPKGDQLDKVARVLGCTVDDLRRPGRPKLPNPPGKFVDDPEKLAWLGLWEEMSPELRALALYRISDLLPPPSIGKRHNG